MVQSFFEYLKKWYHSLRKLKFENCVKVINALEGKNETFGKAVNQE